MRRCDVGPGRRAAHVELIVVRPPAQPRGVAEGAGRDVRALLGLRLRRRTFILPTACGPGSIVWITPISNMKRALPGTAHVPRPIVWLIRLSSCALPAYWWLTYAGLYRWLAELQLDRFRRYPPMETGVLALAICLVLGEILVRVIGALRETELSPADEAALAAGVAARNARWSYWYERWRYWLEYRRGALFGLLVTLPVTGIGVYFCG